MGEGQTLAQQHGHGHTLVLGLDPPAQVRTGTDSTVKLDLASCYSKMSPFQFRPCAVCADLQGAVTHARARARSVRACGQTRTMASTENYRKYSHKVPLALLNHVNFVGTISET